MTHTDADADHLRDAVSRAKRREFAPLNDFAGSALLRAVSFCLGFALFVTAVGLWAFIAPNASVMLIKLGASIVFLGGAVILLLLAIAPHDFYRLEYDRRAGELRMLERDECGRFFVQSSHRLTDLNKLRFESGALRGWNAKGELVLSVPMRARHARHVLQAVLSAA